MARRCGVVLKEGDHRLSTEGCVDNFVLSISVQMSNTKTWLEAALSNLLIELSRVPNTPLTISHIET